MDAKARFNELREELALPRDRLARLLGRPFGTVQAWGNQSRPNMIPPTDVLAKMEGELIAQAISRMRTAGYDFIPRRKAA